MTKVMSERDQPYGKASNQRKARLSDTGHMGHLRTESNGRNEHLTQDMKFDKSENGSVFLNLFH